MKNLIELSGLAVLIGVVALTTVTSKSQTLTVAIKPNTPFPVEFQHVHNAEGYRMWCNGAIVKNYNNAEIAAGRSKEPDADGLYTFTVSAPGLPAGKYTCQISAFYGTNELKSESIVIPIGNIETAPSNFKIVIVK